MAPSRFSRSRHSRRIGEFVDMGDATVETQLVDVVRNVRERAVGGLAYSGGFARQMPPVALPAR